MAEATEVIHTNGAKPPESRAVEDVPRPVSITPEQADYFATLERDLAAARDRLNVAATAMMLGAGVTEAQGIELVRKRGMALGWKVMLPMALVYILVIAGGIYVTDELLHLAPLVRTLVLFGLNLVIGYVVFFLVDRNTIIAGSMNYAAGRVEVARIQGAAVES